MSAPAGTDHHDVVVIGTGFAGLAMAVALERDGHEDFLVLERAASVGGTWRDNRYPGCGCDVPTPLYSFSFAPKPDWSHLYARQPEIRAYMEETADRFGVTRHVRFGADVASLTWEEDDQRWRIGLHGGDELTARVVVGGFGGLTEPNWPAFEGLDDFEGTLVHTAKWDDDLDLTGRRVAVIGTGASAIQLVPEVAPIAERVTVFQRTPPWIAPKLDREIGAREARLYRRVPAAQRAVRGTVFGLTEFLAMQLTKRPALLAGLERVSRRLLRSQVPDPALRAKLSPDYRMGCKRILFSNAWYPAIARDDVDLVTDGIARVTPKGVVDGAGVEHAADVLVCGTGFGVADVFSRMTVTGREGVTLTEAWKDGMEAHRGTSVAGFPNLLLLSGPNTGTGSTSQVFMIESQVHYVSEALRTMRERDVATIEVTREAQRAWNDDLQARMQETVWIVGGCNSWYLDEHGRNRTLYPGLAAEFRRETRTFRPDEHVVELRRSAPTPA
ncbi:NAD(P)/FAD-dependent oxidoreductase [Patulibacter sp.]|uniref:flavin-containing monooxygenase n=1 Tax=Patulibacter sp. TaxID=1912859 RepID=UPI002727A902|nr:NAD(P)/FAD-dependent oxidoreductase [Patulibacter sp.]MDO9410494.1 NAD(P)/FAD-dependent oxidoreductase [Patulibacter sp.]